MTLTTRCVLAGVLCTLVACASSGPPANANRSTMDKTNPLYSLTLLRQGSLLLQQGRFNAALEKFEEADAVSPGNATTHNMIGLCHMRLNNLDQAVISFQRALELVPSFTDARNNRGVTYLAMEQYHLAEIDFASVLGDTTYPHRWEAYYNLGMTFFLRGQLPAAEENFRRAIDAPAPVYEAYLRLAETLALEGEADEAVDMLEEARLRFPQRVEAQLALGRLLIQLGRPGEAERYLQEVVAAQPGSPSAEEASALLGET